MKKHFILLSGLMLFLLGGLTTYVLTIVKQQDRAYVVNPYAWFASGISTNMLIGEWMGYSYDSSSCLYVDIRSDGRALFLYSSHSGKNKRLTHATWRVDDDGRFYALGSEPREYFGYAHRDLVATEEGAVARVLYVSPRYIEDTRWHILYRVSDLQNRARDVEAMVSEEQSDAADRGIIWGREALGSPMKSEVKE